MKGGDESEGKCLVGFIYIHEREGWMKPFAIA
jgi:hypothetical protein